MVEKRRRWPAGTAASAGSDVALPGLAAWQAATVTLLGKARSPGRLDAETTAARWLYRGHRCRRGGRRGDRLGHSHRCRLRSCPGAGTQLGQRWRLGLGGCGGFYQRALASLAGYVLGHGSADKGLTAAPTGGIEAIGGKVSNQNRTSPMRCHVKRAAFSHRLQGLAEPGPHGTRRTALALCHNARHASRFRVSGL